MSLYHSILMSMLWSFLILFDLEANAEVKPRRTLDWSKLKTDAEESMKAYIACEL